MSTDMPYSYWQSKEEEKTCNNCSLRNKCKIYKQHRKSNKVKLIIEVQKGQVKVLIPKKYKNYCSYWKPKSI